jgi:[NiFe] hydrogenase large subunit
LAAAQDGDSNNGQATIRLTGRGLAAAETDKEQSTLDYEIVTDTNTLTVAEGGTARFQGKLSVDPGQTVAVTVGRDSGDADISVASGSSYYFNSSNWDTHQPVTLTAAEDPDDSNGQATLALSAAGVATEYVTAAEQDASVGGAPKRVVIDPVSRIEGHLRFEVEVGDGQVTKAWSTATLFRGIETILAGRDPHDAPLITQRLCGVCTYVHQLCSVRAIEDAASLEITNNARIVRNLMLGAQFLHDHLVHFYHSHDLNWVDITKALSADPVATKKLANSISPTAVPIDFAGVQARLQGLVDTGNLGPFANGYWGHSAYTLSREENLLVMEHYLAALKQQINGAKMMAILGGKNPHPQSTVVAGITCGGELSPARLSDFRAYLDDTRRFVATIYLPDLKVVASRYPEWKHVGAFNNFMACGEFPLGPNVPVDMFMPRGLILNGDILNVENLDESLITEDIACSWYTGSTDRHPANGESVPNYTGMDLHARQSWLKAPRYDDEAMEVGPLARVLVGYGLGRSEFVTAVQRFLDETGFSEADLLSTLGRTVARGIETGIIGDGMVDWLDELENNLSAGNKQIYQDYALSTTSTGIGFLEAPRGALGHWINIQGNTIDDYQMVVPTTWNLGPRCANGIAGPLEQALVGLSVADPANPVEMLRVIHSFDACVACGVHVIDTERDEIYEIKVL